MKTYKRQTTCSELIFKIEKRNGKYKIDARMKKFGDCSAYVFISKIIEEKLNTGEDISKIIDKLKKYKCRIGPSGCIEEIGKCIQDFSESQK